MRTCGFESRSGHAGGRDVDGRVDPGGCPSRTVVGVPDPTSLSKPVVRRIRRLALLAAALAAVALARDRIITDAERRDAERLGLPH